MKKKLVESMKKAILKPNKSIKSPLKLKMTSMLVLKNKPKKEEELMMKNMKWKANSIKWEKKKNVYNNYSDRDNNLKLLLQNPWLEKNNWPKKNKSCKKLEILCLKNKMLKWPKLNNFIMLIWKKLKKIWIKLMKKWFKPVLLLLIIFIINLIVITMDQIKLDLSHQHVKKLVKSNNLLKLLLM